MQINGYKFQDPNLFMLAVTHPSLSKGGAHYERLEFLGDKILGCVLAGMLYKSFPDLTEGELSVMHSKLSATPTVAVVARNLQLDKHMLLDAGEEQGGGRENERNLENVMEALLAAIYLDSGGNWELVNHFICQHWQHYLQDADMLRIKDAKTRLQEWAQKRGKPLPHYKVISTKGQSHRPEFTVTVHVNGLEDATGVGASKKQAEMAAAVNMLEGLE